MYILLRTIDIIFFDPYVSHIQMYLQVLDSLRHRAVHIMRRLFPIVEAAIKKSVSLSSVSNPHIDAANGPFKDEIRAIYDRFVDIKIEMCLSKCRDDLKGMTRYVTWDTDGRGGSAALYKSLPTPKRMVEIYSVAVEQKNEQRKGSVKDGSKGNKKRGPTSLDDKIMSEWGAAQKDSSPAAEVVDETALTPKQWSDDETQVMISLVLLLHLRWYSNVFSLL